MLRLEVETDGTMHCLQADQCIEVSDYLLRDLDGTYARYGDGVLTFLTAEGEISYGLRDHDDIRETWTGVRSDFPLEDDEVMPTREGGS